MTSLVLRSDHDGLTELFDWAARTAASHLVSAGTVGPLDADERQLTGRGIATYVDCYRAGYGHRSGYYLRDFCHQAVGAQLLGWHHRNLAMLTSFVASVVDGWPAWALNFDGVTPLAIDVAADGRRVRELPAVFELVETVQALHRWSGDPALVCLLPFARASVTDFVAAHDVEHPNGVAEAGGPTIFDGIAGYDESPDPPLFEAGEGIAAQYAATRHVAALASSARDRLVLEAAAVHLLRLYQQLWSRDGGEVVVSGWTRTGAPAVGWHREATFFPGLKGLQEGDPRAAAERERIDALCQDAATAPRNLEALTYLPDLYLRNGDPERGFAWMQRIYAARDQPHSVALQGLNGSYPEVAFTLVAQAVAGLLGLEPDAPNGRLALAPRLPRAVSSIEVDGVPFGDGQLDLAYGPAGAKVLNRTSAPIEVNLVRRRRGVFRDPHLGTASAHAVTVAPGETVELSRARRR